MVLTIRNPAVAGYFYPARKELLLKKLDELLGGVPARPPEGSLRGLIVPHAGLDYSGSAAARGYAVLRDSRQQPRRVVVIGPPHTTVLEGLAADPHDCWRTPLGEIPVWSGGFRNHERSHRREHSLEVQLPFLQYLLGHFELLPLLAGKLNPPDHLGALQQVCTDETLLVVSSDLSHFYDYETARRLDGDTLAAIEALDYEKMAAGGIACGRIPILLAILLARHNGWRCRLLHYQNSGDVTGDYQQVVGYGSLAFFG